MKSTAFLFDMDGVLVDSNPVHVKAWQKYLRQLGVDVQDLERRMHGRRNIELVQDLFGSGVSEEEAKEHGAAKERVFRDMMLEKGVRQYEVAGVLQFLKRYRDIPKAMASNAERANIDFTLDHFGLREFFPVAVDGDQVNRPKPYPDIYLKAAEELGVDPRACIVFEDSPAGAQAGIDAGMKVVAVESSPADFHNVSLRISDLRTRA